MCVCKVHTKYDMKYIIAHNNDCQILHWQFLLYQVPSGSISGWKKAAWGEMFSPHFRIGTFDMDWLCRGRRVSITDVNEVDIHDKLFGWVSQYVLLIGTWYFQVIMIKRYNNFSHTFLIDNHVRLHSSQNASYTEDVCDMHLRLTAKPHLCVICSTFHT